MPRGPMGHGPGAGRAVEKPNDFGKVMGKLVHYCRNYIPVIAVALVLGAIGTICQIIGPDKLKEMTNAIVNGQFAVDHEYIFRQVYDGIGDHLAVAVLGLEGERDGLADLLAQDCFLEFGKQHACPEDEFERLSRTRLVCDLSVDGELVVHADHFVLFYFHVVIL